MNINENIPIVYDPEKLTNIKEMIKEGFEKLNRFVKAKINEKKVKTPNFEFYNELDQKFDEIASKLKELKLYDEFNFFLSISDYILYIVYQNSIDSTFGHCNFAIELLNFFTELFKTNTEFYYSSVKISHNEFKTIQKKFKEKYWNYRYLFYGDIYQSSGSYTDEKMYEIHKSLRE
ncbi:MAG: hypothetical protein E7Z81_01230 [Methanobrevibacter sp.]|jgi:hypothetical protein|uniref:hypothetical protein n=1 Tax=Methanobrevibacter sp. TaxID=66852 RepID=UPI0025DA5219|nr:hypothetical protein [Methanobrevibacter sp.]MBE6496897.1 hypothetical protein [Methanobrevibacter sp.]